MILQLHDFFVTENLRRSVQYRVAEEDLQEIHGYAFKDGLDIDGMVESRSGIVTLRYRVTCIRKTVCDRCLAEIERSYCYDFTHTVLPCLENDSDWDDGYLVAEHDCLDMDETAIADLLLMLPTKTLCREDCKGLCMHCGCNLNYDTCDCQEKMAESMEKRTLRFM